MDSLLQSIFGAAGPVPRIETWPAELVVLHGFAEGAIGVASLVIAGAVLLLLRRAPRMPRSLRIIALLLGAFVFLGGVASLAGLMTVWFEVYSGAGFLRLAAAVVAVAAALVLVRMLPRLAALPSPEDLRAANERLRVEGAAREDAFRQLEQARNALEDEVKRRTRELAEVTRLFEAATSGADVAVAAQDTDLRYSWVHNPWLGEPEAVLGRTDEELLPRPGADLVIAGKRGAIELDEPQTFEVELGADGETLWRRFVVTPLHDGEEKVTGLVSISFDVTRAKRLEAMRGDLSRRLAETVQFFNLALRSSEIFVFSLDGDLNEVWSNRLHNPLTALMANPQAQESRQQQALRTLLHEAVEAQVPRYAEIDIGEGDARTYFDLHIEPRAQAEGEVSGVVCAAVDVTERKRNEQRMRLVMRELSHRSKNLLTVVQAIARQTADQAENVPSFVEGFGQRLRALAGAQDLLVADNWVGADLASLVRGQTLPYAPTEGDRVLIEGPALRLSPQATQTVALALHELATNAAKHGAFSNNAGTVSVSWTIETEGHDEPMLRLAWRETGGPPVVAPTRRGFGRIVVEFNVSRSLNAEVKLDFAESGVRADFLIPAYHLVDEPRQAAAAL